MSDLAREVDPRFRPNGRTWPQLWNWLIATGGAGKTTYGSSMAVTLALRGYVITYFDLDQQCNGSAVLGHHPDVRPAGQPDIVDMILGTKTFEECRVPARYVLQKGKTRDQDVYLDIPNLYLIPGSRDLSNGDTLLGKHPARFNWFKDFLRDEYEGDDDMFFIDNPANYGALVGTVAMMLDEDDETVPPCLSSTKTWDGFPPFFTELERLREEHKNSKAIPGRPTVKRIPMLGVQLGKKQEKDNRAARENMERDYPHLLAGTPYVRYSAVAKGLIEKRLPLPILAPNNEASADFRKVASAWGFPDIT
ncbi:ParA family protein [Kitasatospora sp. NPDC101801]|uniref:ParA family protein n=1 Tax=Kitasatospora sp. NPDC101801 TaxID=3364103 RepID=UPI0037F1F0AD